LFAVARAIGRKTDPLRGFVITTSERPAVLGRVDRNSVPKASVLGFVVSVEVTDIKTTDVAQDLVDAFVAPMVG
jgi:hypothetical protein